MGRAPLRLVWQARGPKAPGPPNAAAPPGRAFFMGPMMLY